MTQDNTLGKYIYIDRHMHKCIIVVLIESIWYHTVYSWEGQTIFTEWFRTYRVLYSISISTYYIYIYIIYIYIYVCKYIVSCVIQMQNWQLPPKTARFQVRASIAEIWSSCSLLGAYGFDPQAA